MAISVDFSDISTTFFGRTY